MLAETYRRVGVSAFCKALSDFVETCLIIIAVSKSSLTSPDADPPIRRLADTFPLASDNAYQFYQPIG